MPDYSAGIPRKRITLAEPPAPQGFDPKRALRRAGLAAQSDAIRTGELAAPFARAFNRYTGLERAGIGATLMFAGFTVLGLALLDAALRGRGPAAVERILALAGGGVQRLFAASDPIIGYAAPEGGYEPVARTPLSPGARAAGRVEETRDVPGAPGFRRARRIVPLPGHAGVRVDAGLVALVGWIERTFKVRATSGHRSPARNEAVGGADNSDHLDGLAVDFAGTTAAMRRLANWARLLPFAYVEFDPLPATRHGDPDDHDDHVHISFFRR